MKGGERPIIVWDVPTRLFHWLVVALVIAAYVTLELNWMDMHAWIGEAVLALVLFRLLWGFLGSDTALFSRFIKAPGVAIRHLAHLFRREPDHQIGHNPAGGWMVLLLLFLLLGETLSGLYVANDVADDGPFTEIVPASVADAITRLHAIFWYALLAAITLHVAAILVYWIAKRQNLVLPMITGRKSLPAGAPLPRLGTVLRAAILLTASVLAVAALATYS
ncbi:MAG TPA: cytochrome b/b6 domain-containing protein [Stellaceae bacterium]|nr:cytochrome b/b6 domain-containing protein [Stellaceae bacterium]